MFKSTKKRSTGTRRARGTTSAARSHACTTDGPRPIVTRSTTTDTEPGTSRRRANASEQPTEPSPKRPRSHSQDRTQNVTHTESQPPAPVYAGIDVASNKLDYAFDDHDRIVTLANDPDAHQRIVRDMQRRNVAVIAIESTGGIERPLIHALLEANLPVALVQPADARHFAKSMRKLAKTDAIDARVLAQYAKKGELRLLAKTPEKQAELAALVTCRRQLLSVRTQQTNRRGRTSSKTAIKAIDTVLATINEQIEQLDKTIQQLIQDDDQFKDRDRILRSAPGIGAATSASLLSQLSELGHVDRQAAAALLGVAPMNNQSGDRDRPRRVKGGRVAPRCNLYMATLAAIRFNPLIKAFADRLKAKNKQSKVVIVACMRKLACLLNAMLRDKIEWNQLNAVKALDA
ncbi:MAG TPA: IS110 family transposase [Lacipirellulaceae bacterium]|nr:IS110 family transposase [Lacipirellulaceae bacterium]